ncbi:MAG TPA: hypothetical protein VFV66_27635 [Nonomuraea sp.]|nr:hypothetical protein [Nonomuraea sp.]
MKRILLPAGGAILATGLLAAGLASTASASGEIVDTPLTPNNKVAETVDFWLKANGAALRAASYYRYDYKEVNKLNQSGGYTADTKPGSTAPIGEEKKPAVKVQNVNLPRTIGKVFFEGRDGKLYWCSATSIQSNYRNLVATAGHCVYQTSTNGHVLNKWVFVPGYYQGKAPWGIYVGKQAYTHYDFANFEDGDRDYAFVTVYNGIRLTNGEKKVVSKADWDKYEGIKDISFEEISAADYQKCVDYNGGETLDCFAKTTDYDDVVGPDYAGAIRVLKEVTKEQYDAAPTGRVNGGKAQNATIVENVTESEYKAYTGPGYQKKDAAGNYTITHYYVKYWVKRTTSVKYYKSIFYVLDGFSKDVGRLGDNVGGQGFAWNQPTGKYVRTFGYPGGEHPDGNKPYTGVTPKWCYGKTGAKVSQHAATKSEELVSLKCAVTPGYNGSPWLLKYSNAKRLGYVNGVTSSVFGDLDKNNRFDYIFSSYFDGETAAIYKAAANQWSGPVG